MSLKKTADQTIQLMQQWKAAAQEGRDYHLDPATDERIYTEEFVQRVNAEIKGVRRYPLMPTGKAVTQMEDTISMTDARADRWIERAPQDHTRRYLPATATHGAMTREEKKGEDGSIQDVITVEAQKEFAKVGGTAKKILSLTLQTAAVQSMDGGMLLFPEASFSLQTLAELGIFSNERSARAGFKRCMEKLTGLKVHASIRKGKDTVKSAEELTVPFIGYSIKKGVCSVFLNPRIDWRAIAVYYVAVPKYYYSLQNTAAELLLTMCRQLRMNGKHATMTDEEGMLEDCLTATLSIPALLAHLSLPTPSEAKDHAQRDIVRPISEALEAIADAQSREYKNADVCIRANYEPTIKISEFCKKENKLEIVVKGDALFEFEPPKKKIEPPKKAAPKRRKAKTAPAEKQESAPAG